MISQRFMYGFGIMGLLSILNGLSVAEMSSSLNAIESLYEDLLQKEYAEPMLLSERVERKASRSPSLRLRFGRSFMPNENSARASRTPRLRFGRSLQPQKPCIGRLCVEEPEVKIRPILNNLNYGFESVIRPIEQGDYRGREGSYVWYNDQMGKLPTWAKMPIEEKRWFGDVNQKPIRSPSLRLRFGRVDPEMKEMEPLHINENDDQTQSQINVQMLRNIFNDISKLNENNYDPEELHVEERSAAPLRLRFGRRSLNTAHENTDVFHN